MKERESTAKITPRPSRTSPDAAAGGREEVEAEEALAVMESAPGRIGGGFLVRRSCAALAASLDPTEDEETEEEMEGEVESTPSPSAAGAAAAAADPEKRTARISRALSRIS